VSDNSQLWELIYEPLGWFREQDEAGNGQLLQLCDALSLPYQPIYDLVRERDDEPAPFAVLLDPDRCPAKWLPHLAQWVGVIPTPEMSEEQLRAEIKQPTGWKRGQPEAIRLATKRTLKPVVEGEELFVIIHPRTPEVWHHYIRTLLAQTPNPSRTQAILREELPAWEALEYEAISGVTVADVAASTKWTTVADLAADFPSVQVLAEILPSEL
jgi:hypothetical protein